MIEDVTVLPRDAGDNNINNFLKCTWMGAVLSLGAWQVRAADLTISLMGSDPITRHTVKFQCDGQAGALGLPAGVFPVEYVNGNGNSLAVLPIKGHSLIHLVECRGARRSPLCQPRCAVRQGPDCLPDSEVTQFP